MQTHCISKVLPEQIPRRKKNCHTRTAVISRDDARNYLLTLTSTLTFHKAARFCTVTTAGKYTVSTNTYLQDYCH